MIDHEVIKEIEAARDEMWDAPFLWAQPRTGEVKLFRSESAGSDVVYFERSWTLDPETMAEAEQALLFDEVM